MSEINDKDIEKKIHELFTDNYELLSREAGHLFSENEKSLALIQVLYYWRRLKELAQNVTETEVPLSLPNQKTNSDRKFSIDGVVDIIKDRDDVWMYDIKTHDPEYIRENKDLYEEQLNVYAHIWQKLRGKQLNKTAIISTSLPKPLKAAIQSGDTKKIQEELKKWEPLIELPFDQKKVEKTIENFKEVVDCIEDHHYKAPKTAELGKKAPGSKFAFVTRVCANCDARFSCDPYREHVVGAGRSDRFGYRKYIEISLSEDEKEEWVNTNLEADLDKNRY